jgi:hypothetical protein
MCKTELFQVRVFWWVSLNKETNIRVLLCIRAQHSLGWVTISFLEEAHCNLWFGMLTNFMELNPSWKAATREASQELTNDLSDPKCNYQAYKSAATVLITSQIKLVHMIPSDFSKIHINIIHARTPRSSYWSVFSWLSYQYPIGIHLIYSCYMHSSCYAPWLDYSNYTWRRTTSVV